MGLICSKNAVEESVTPHFSKRERSQDNYENQAAPKPENPRTYRMNQTQDEAHSRLQPFALGGACCGTFGQGELNHM